MIRIIFSVEWHNCNGAGHVNKAKLRRAKSVLRLVTTWWAYHSGPLSLAIPLWVGATSTGNNFNHRWRRNGKYCIAILAYCTQV